MAAGPPSEAATTREVEAEAETLSRDARAATGAARRLLAGLSTPRDAGGIAVCIRAAIGARWAREPLRPALGRRAAQSTAGELVSILAT